MIMCWVAVQVTLGYVIPLAGLAWLEIMERYDYAKLMGLEVEDLQSTVRRELGFVLKMVVQCALAAAVCFWGY
eukprot:jgi/Botrbrau1/11370/Bobra.0038s0118.1